MSIPMAPIKRPYGYWAIKKNVLDAAKDYASKALWQRASPGAFSSAQKHGWLVEASAHMGGGHRPSGYWTQERLIEDAKRYDSPTAWKKGNASAYATALAKDVREICCAHMRRVRQPEGYWTKDKVLSSAARYDTIIAWSLGDGPAYDMAKRRHWYKEATAHMVKTYSHGEYTIYCYLLQHDIPFTYQKRFDDLRDKAQLPYDFYVPDYSLVVEYQGRQHFSLSKSSMYRKDFAEMQRRDDIKRTYSEKVGLNYLEIDVQNCAEIESLLESKLREIALLQGAPAPVLTGRQLRAEERSTLASLGTWTKEAVLADAKRFSLRKDWDNCGNSACQIAYKNGWIEEATAHMTPSQKPKGYWTKVNWTPLRGRHEARRALSTDGRFGRVRRTGTGRRWVTRCYSLRCRRLV